MASNPWFSWDYVTRNADRLSEALVEHVTLTVLALLLGLLISLPLGVLAARVPRLSTPVLAVAGVIYTIPALATIVALVPLFGAFSPWTVLVPLTAYTLVIIVRNVVTGLEGVPPDAVEAARGMGYGSARRLLAVEAPLALPAVVAGVRVAAVSTVALVTIGGLVDQGGFGNLLFGALNTLQRAPALTATLGCVLLAVVLDLGLLGVQRLATPWARR